MNRLYTVLIFIAILGMCVYLFFVALQPQYFSRTAFVLVPENELIGTHMDNVLNDVVFIMRESLDNDTVLAKYGAYIKIEHIDQTDIVSVSVYARSINAVTFVEKYALEKIIQDVHTYYATDIISMQIVQHDRVPQRTMTAIAVPYIVMFFIATGLIAGVVLLFHHIDQLRDRRTSTLSINGKKIFEKFHKGHQEVHVMRYDEPVMEETKLPVESLKDLLVEEKESIADQDKITPKEEIIAPSQQAHKPAVEIAIPDGVSATPGNLPIVDVSTLGFAKPKREKQEVDMEQYKEPTEDELKARLNALLSGKL